ncbi:MAG: DEAD/DEAH box helicase [Prevotella sp.]|nr:DEAD/DEAH box helicase [Prevotella sp.]
MSYALFDYQKEMKARICEAFGSCLSVMCQMPTGTGKTHLLAAVVKDFMSHNSNGGKNGSMTDDSNGVVWIVAHRRELVAQIEDTLERHCRKYGEMLRNDHLKVFSMQWLSRNWDKVNGCQPGLIVIDEAHHSLAASYRELWEHYPKARKLGMTATPCRLNGHGFTNLFDILISSWGIAEFIRRGRLAAFDYVSISAKSREQLLIDSLLKRGADGDYQLKEMNEVLNCMPSIERLYQSVERFAHGKKGIVYAIGIAHARAIAELYKLHGINAVAIDSKTPTDVRKRYVEEFKQGVIRVMVNVDVFSEGFDCPDVEFIQLARPTLSLAKYLQQVGRGLRLSKGKCACMIIDNVGLYRSFGLPTRSWDWKAMFLGREINKGMSFAQKTSNGNVSLLQDLYDVADDDMQVVMTHDRLLASLRANGVQPCNVDVLPLKGFENSELGLWGLRRGNVIVSEPKYNKVLAISGNFALVRFQNMRLGVVNGLSGEEMRLDDCRNATLLPEGLLQVINGKKEILFVDLLNNQWYNECPRVVSFGGIELLHVGDRFFSRTKVPYSGVVGMSERAFVRKEFYLELHEYGVPPVCQVNRSVPMHHAVRCIVEGDDRCVYTLCEILPDKSIVVIDNDGRISQIKN